jgi:hypothetical protein
VTKDAHPRKRLKQDELEEFFRKKGLSGFALRVVVLVAKGLLLIVELLFAG